MNKFQFETPWIEENKQLFIQELKKEISPAHILWDKKVTVIARREDCDDVLYKVEDADFEYAVVHLTWTNKIELNPKFPYTETYKIWDELVENRLLPDIQEYKSL